MYTAFVVKLWVSKEVKPVKFWPLSLFCVVRLFRFYYFRRFRHSERGIKSLRLEVTFVKILHSFLFCWRIWPFLLLPGRTCRTWTILWTERLLSKSGHGMATPELMTMTSGQWRQYGRNHKLGGSLCYEKGASGNGFLPKEKFRAPVSRQVKTLKVLKETVRWVDLSLRAQENSKEVWVPTTSLHL